MLLPITLGGLLAGIIGAIIVAVTINRTPASREGGLVIAETQEVLVFEPQTST